MKTKCLEVINCEAVSSSDCGCECPGCCDEDPREWFSEEVYGLLDGKTKGSALPLRHDIVKKAEDFLRYWVAAQVKGRGGIRERCALVAENSDPSLSPSEVASRIRALVEE